MTAREKPRNRPVLKEVAVIGQLRPVRRSTPDTAGEARDSIISGRDRYRGITCLLG